MLTITVQTRIIISSSPVALAAPFTDQAYPVPLALGSGRVESPDLEVWLRSPRLTSALDAAFPNMQAWAKEHIPIQFKKYAGEADDAGLDKASFTKVNST